MPFELKSDVYEYRVVIIEENLLYSERPTITNIISKATLFLYIGKTLMFPFRLGKYCITPFSKSIFIIIINFLK